MKCSCASYIQSASPTLSIQSTEASMAKGKGKGGRKC